VTDFPAVPSRTDYLKEADSLVVLRGEAESAEVFLVLHKSGAVTAFNGHVDLGTGIRTALAQIVAEELDVSLERVSMVLGDTARAPDQGATIASATIQVAALPLRHAAAQARQFLLAQAVVELKTPVTELTVEDGVIHAPGGLCRSYGDLLSGQSFRLQLSLDAPLKPAESYKIIGLPVARTDIPAKATGQAVFVHDVRVPGMLHGRVVRPPYAGRDSGDFVGQSLLSIDHASLSGIPGIVAVVVEGDFIGIVAEREENAARAAQILKVSWKPWPALPDLGDLKGALRANPSQPRLLLDKGDVDQAIAGAAQSMPRTYVWPYQMHGSIGPSCSVADYQDGRLTVWSGTQNPHILRTDLARLLEISNEAVDINRLEAAGCYGRNCADDVGGDAALLARAVGRPVRVQLTREQEHAWEPKGAAQLMEVKGGLNADGSVAAYDFSTRYPSNGAPLLALLLTGRIAPLPAIFEMGDRTSIPPYDYDNMRVVVHDMPPIVRASWLRGVSALPNSFAHESYIDELATAAGVDPIEFRLRYLKDPRGVDLVKAVAERAGWVSRSGPNPAPGDGDILQGRGFAYALYVHSKFPGFGSAWSAWVADVAVNRRTGEVSVTKVTVGQDSGLMINPAGVLHQVEGNVIQSTSRALEEQVTFDRFAVVSQEWGAYPIMTFPKLPEIDVLLVPRPDQPPLGSGESASVPSAAAIANAIFDATGVRFREPPFTPERILAGLQPVEGERKNQRRKRRLIDFLSAAAVTAIGIAASAFVWRGAIAPIAPPDPTLYSAATLARGEALAGIGACAVCHTAAEGQKNAGGLGLETPFGIVYSTNITPDPETGIGSWSYPAFERAMKGGISRDGRHLYPAFPYTAFTRMSDADLQALYAYLMAQSPVRAETPATRLAFPFNLRPIMAGWNALFLRPGPQATDANRSAEWNRGAYLVEGAGHCGACHSPRNVLGAEKGGAAHLSGGMVEGWEAPPLTALSYAPIAWSEEELFRYLRTGYAPLHGAAGGSMAPVVASLGSASDQDIRAMAIYLASINPPNRTPAEQQADAVRLEARAGTGAQVAASSAARLYEGACASCHQAGAGGPALSGMKPSLALSSTLHSPRPDNLIRKILMGAAKPSNPMPGFRDSLNDQQIADLAAYLRGRFAPDAPPWGDMTRTVARIRARTSL